MAQTLYENCMKSIKNNYATLYISKIENGINFLYQLVLHTNTKINQVSEKSNDVQRIIHNNKLII